MNREEVMPDVIRMMSIAMLVPVFVMTTNSNEYQASSDNDGKVEKIAGGFKFVEGPLWIEGAGLLFSDISDDKIYRWSPEAGVSIYMDPSGSSNGLTADGNGNLVFTQMKYRRISRMEKNGSIAPLADNYDGLKFNSPNDLVVGSDGSIYFTDPPFNIPEGERRELDFSGIYRIDSSGSVRLLDNSLALPNGICFSPDGKLLYVNDSRERIIYVWDLAEDLNITRKRKFASIEPDGYLDGMKTDPDGNLYCAGPVGIWIFSPEGEHLGTIPVPEQTTNLAWGDDHRRTLYVTSGGSVYRIADPYPVFSERE